MKQRKASTQEPYSAKFKQFLTINPITPLTPTEIKEGAAGDIVIEFDAHNTNTAIDKDRTITRSAALDIHDTTQQAHFTEATQALRLRFRTRAETLKENDLYSWAGEEDDPSQNATFQLLQELIGENSFITPYSWMINRLHKEVVLDKIRDYCLKVFGEDIRTLMEEVERHTRELYPGISEHDLRILLRKIRQEIEQLIISQYSRVFEEDLIIFDERRKKVNGVAQEVVDRYIGTDECDISMLAVLFKYFDEKIFVTLRIFAYDLELAANIKKKIKGSQEKTRFVNRVVCDKLEREYYTIHFQRDTSLIEHVQSTALAMSVVPEDLEQAREVLMEQAREYIMKKWQYTVNFQQILRCLADLQEGGIPIREQASRTLKERGIPEKQVLEYMSQILNDLALGIAEKIAESYIKTERGRQVVRSLKHLRSQLGEGTIQLSKALAFVDQKIAEAEQDIAKMEKDFHL